MLDIVARGEKEDPRLEAAAFERWEKPHEPNEVDQRVGKA
jgi:hypothetical protein